MSIPLDLVYAGIAFTAFVLAMMLVPLARLFGLRYGFVDAVNPAKIHAESKVRCGGIGIVFAFMLTVGTGIVAAFLLRGTAPVPPHLGRHLINISSISERLFAVLGGATILFATGLIDDRINLRPSIKLAMQILSALPLIWTGITIKLFIPGPVASAVFTIAWVILLTNSFNFIDNMNGLSSGVACVCALNFYLISRAGGEYFMMAMFAALLGSLLGFLRYNFPNAQLFMGDSGSLFIGYMLAALSIMVTYYEAGVPTQLPVAAPLIVLGLPIFDTASVMLIRWRSGKPLMQGDQNHFSHRLVRLGFTRTRAVMFIWLITFTIGLTAVNLRSLNWTGALVALVQVVLFFLVIYCLENVAPHAQKSSENRP